MTQVSESTGSDERDGTDGSQPHSVAPIVSPAERVAIFAQSYEFPETAERLVVDKQLIVREELTVRKVVESHTEQIDETVRRTEVEVERLPANAPAATPVAQAAPPPVANTAEVQAPRPVASEPPAQVAPAPAPPVQPQPPVQEVSFVDPAVAEAAPAQNPAPLVFGLKDRAASTAQAKEPSPARAAAEPAARIDHGVRETQPLVFGIDDRPPAAVAPKEQPSAARQRSEGSDIPQSWWIWCAILSVLAIVLAFYGGSLLATL